MGARKLNNNLNIIAKNLRKYREERKMSQPDICRDLALMGITMFNNDIYKIFHALLPPITSIYQLSGGFCVFYYFYPHQKFG